MQININTTDKNKKRCIKNCNNCDITGLFLYNGIERGDGMAKKDTLPEAVWRENEAYIRRICAYKLSSHPDEIDDAVQEIGLAYFAAAEKGVEIREPRRWLTVVANNILKDIYSHMSKDAARLASIDAEEYRSIPAPEEPEAVPEEALLRCREGFLSGLNEEERLLYRLRFEKRMKIKKIAEKTGLSEGNVRVRIFRLKQKAKRYVGDWAEEHL